MVASLLGEDMHLGQPCSCPVGGLHKDVYTWFVLLVDQGDISIWPG